VKTSEVAQPPFLDARLRWSLRSALAAAVALLVAVTVNWPHPHWAAIAVVVLMAPRLDTAVLQFPFRIAGVAVGAFLGLVTVALCGQDRTPLLLACSFVLAVVSVSTSSLRFGPFFLMAGIAFPPVVFLGIMDFENTAVTAFYRFASVSLGVLIFTVSHLLIFPESAPADSSPPTAEEGSSNGWEIPKWRWLSGLRTGVGCALTMLLWYEVEVPGTFTESLMACILLVVCSAMPAPRILFALGGITCGIATAFGVTYCIWAPQGPGPETLFLSIFPFLALFAFVQSKGPPYSIFGTFASVVFLIDLSISLHQSFDPAKFFNRSLGLLLGGVVTTLLLRLLWPNKTAEDDGQKFF